MNHYFDDVFSRHIIGQSTKFDRPKIRRSSTSRSIGARSDFDEEDVRSVETENEDRLRERLEADAHTANYVSEQLSRVRSHQSADYFEKGDEFEAQLDGQ